MNVSETVDALNKWLHTVGVDFREHHAFAEAYAFELRNAGVPVDRIWFSALVLHPLVAARAMKWESSGNISKYSWSRKEYREYRENLAQDEEAKRNNSPMYQIIVGANSVRIKATDDYIPPHCDWMIKENYTDLYGLPTPGTSSDSSKRWSLDSAAHGQLEGGFTWSTKAKAGFTDEQIEVLNETIFALSTVFRLYIARTTAKTLLMTYLGTDAGLRVYEGEIERGEGLTVRSVIWFSDVRGFTQMSGELNRHELVDLINAVFEVTETVIRKHSGQVLKYMGDGCMAIFTAHSTGFQRMSFSSDEKVELDDEHGSHVCLNARLAAAEVQHRLEELKGQREEKGLRAASVGVGLHYGDISYGNVGAPERLDFTVLGPHVNLASRTESLCAKLGAKVLATEDFVKLDAHEGAWTSRGEHKVKGVNDPVPIYELDVASESS